MCMYGKLIKQTIDISIYKEFNWENTSFYFLLPPTVAFSTLFGFAVLFCFYFLPVCFPHGLEAATVMHGLMQPGFNCTHSLSAFSTCFATQQSIVRSQKYKMLLNSILTSAVALVSLAVKGESPKINFNAAFSCFLFHISSNDAK